MEIIGTIGVGSCMVLLFICAIGLWELFKLLLKIGIDAHIHARILKHKELDLEGYEEIRKSLNKVIEGIEKFELKLPELIQGK